MRQTFWLLFNSKFYYGFVFIYVIFAWLVAVFSASFLGFKFLVVKSDSMQPSIQAGSLLFIKESQEYQVGDVIS